MAKLVDVSPGLKGTMGLNLIFDKPVELLNVANLVIETYQADLSKRGIERRVSTSPTGDSEPSYGIEVAGCRTTVYKVMRASQSGKDFVWADLGDESSLGEDSVLLVQNRYSLMLKYLGKEV